MYTTEFILKKIGVTGVYKMLYCIMNDDITDNTKLTAYQILNYYDSYINESLGDLDANRVINTLRTLEYDDSSILNVILRLINNEEALR
nr:hypothetical protein [Methanobrevibacter smithii]